MAPAELSQEPAPFHQESTAKPRESTGHKTEDRFRRNFPSPKAEAGLETRERCRSRGRHVEEARATSPPILYRSFGTGGHRQCAPPPNRRIAPEHVEDRKPLGDTVHPPSAESFHELPC